MNILHKFRRASLISTIKNAILLIVIVTTKYIEIITVLWICSIYYDIVHISLDSTTTM